MRWLSTAAAVQLLCLLDIATAIPDYGFGVDHRLEPRREALLMFKRQADPFCRQGYYQCPPEFGGGCCADGRKCATRDCPAIRPGQEDIPNAFTDTRPPQTFTNPPPSAVTAGPATSTSEPTETTGETSTEAPETTTGAQTTSAATTDTDTEAPTTTEPSTTGPSTEASSTETNTGSQSGTATNAADAAETTTGAPVADGTMYTPMGISSGAIVGIVFAGITGAVIVGLVIWRAIIGIRHPKKKGRKPAPPAVGAAGAGAAGGFFSGNRRIFGAISNPFGGKKSGPGAAESMIPRSADDDDTAPMSQSAAAMGFGPQPGGQEGAPPYVQDRSSLEEQDTSYNRPTYTGGDLGYRGVDTYDRQDDDTQGLFPRSGGFPNR
ncbi:hypothetical protein TWF730_008253 [Orbilia blumenaviensis]|uniref:Uncharacterized protein n=1 Tax=Orbilia blumenaviensis TaxID=1796055 RepID=A0AAV9V4Y4_9PEZI